MDEQVLKAIAERCLVDYWSCHRGQILYSGLDTLVPGRFYFLGFNPAADGTNPLLRNVPIMPRDWSAYVHQCWHRGCGVADRRVNQCTHSPKLHQRQVIGIMNDLGLVPARTFATNLFFVESRSAAELNTRRLWEPCWSMHREMLAIVRPQYIVCLGNGDGISAFSLLHHRLQPEAVIEVHGGRKKFVGRFDVGRGGDLTAMVVGVHHPSRPMNVHGLRDFIECHPAQ